MPKIDIRGTIIDFPNTGTAPDWSKTIIQFAQAVEEALKVATGKYDVSAQTLDISASNPISNQDIAALSFPVSEVQSVKIYYSVYRETNVSKITEEGEINLVYNPDNPVNKKWEMTREFQGDAKISFNVLDSGQVQYSTTTLSGLNHKGFISFYAKATLKQENI